MSINNNKFLPVDVIKAGIKIHRIDMNLSGYKSRPDNPNQLYKILVSDNETLMTFNYNIEHQWFSLKVSVPKLLFGTNARNIPISCTEIFIELVNKHLAEEGIFIDFSLFQVSLLEISNNYICSNVEDKSLYINCISKKEIPRKQKKVYKSSVVFKNKTSRTTVYDKKEELLSRGNDSKISSNIERTLRVEHKLHKKGIKKYFDDCSVKNILFSDFLEEIFLLENIKAGFHLEILSKKIFYRVLRNLIDGKNQAYQNKVLKFYKDLNLNGEDWVKKKYSKYVIKKYKSIMESSGFSSIYINKLVNPIDFMNIEKESTKRMNKKEANAFVAKCKKNKKSFINEVKAFISLCLPCNFLKDILNSCKKIIKFFNTS